MISSRVKGICGFLDAQAFPRNVADIKLIAKACEEAGADALALINTLYALAIDPFNWKINLTNFTGGLRSRH